MTRDTDIRSPEEFEAALADAVEDAVAAGVDVRGSWAFETAGSHHDWEVEVVELVRDPGEDD